jgi:hypothetical protein
LPELARTRLTCAGSVIENIASALRFGFAQRKDRAYSSVSRAF